MKKFIILLFFCLIIIPNLSFAKIVEIGNCYAINKAFEVRETQNKLWNLEDYERFNTFYGKIYDEPFKDSNNIWTVSGGGIIGSNDDVEREIKEFKKEGYLGFKLYDKMVLSIDLSNNIITELKVPSDRWLDYSSDVYLELIRLKNKFPSKWKTSGGNYTDEDNLKRWKEESSKEFDIKKFKIEEYVGGILFGRQFDSLQYSNGWAIRVNLNKLTYKQWFYNEINNRNVGNIYLCTDAKNINTNNKINKKSNSGLKELLKKIY